MTHHRLLPLALVTLLLVLGACGDDQTSLGTDPSENPTVDEPTATPGDPAPDDPAPDEPEPEDTVFVWAETGGCAMAGPNCARYEVRADGTVHTYREGGTDAIATGMVAPDAVAAWLDAVEATDVAALVERVGPGELTAAFDGVDHTVSAPLADIELSSVDVAFAAGEPLFDAARALAAAAADAAPLELETR